MGNQEQIPPNDRAGEANEFRRAADAPQPGFFVEFGQFLLHNKKWWLLPILLVLLAIGILAALSATPLAPLIYTLF
jgi:hypothetical protein